MIGARRRVVRTYSTTPLRSHLYWKRRDILSEMQLRQYMKDGSVSRCSPCNSLVHNTLRKIYLHLVTDPMIPQCAVCLRGQHIRHRWSQITLGTVVIQVTRRSWRCLSFRPFLQIFLGVAKTFPEQ